MKRFKIIFLIVQACHWFNYCQGMHLLNTPHSLHWYIKYKRDFSTAHDPFNEYTSEQRIHLCNIYLNARSFSLVRTEQELRQYVEGDFPDERRYSNFQISGLSHSSSNNVPVLQYNTRRMKLTRLKKSVIPIKMFPCVVYSEEVFMTYGFCRNYIFLIKKPVQYDDTKLKFFGMLESSATLDVRLMQNRGDMNSYFWNSVREVAESSSIYSQSNYKVMEFCELSSLEHYRLCSTVAAALNAEPVFELNLRKDNFIINPEIRCYFKVIVDESGSRINARVLPCAINKTWNTPQFYLLRDPNTSLDASVFVLRTNTHDELVLEAQVDDVGVLKNPL